MKRLGSRLVAVCASLAVCACVLPAVGYATAGFGISRFEMKPTIVHEFSETISGTERHRFVNEPYAYTKAGGHPYALTTWLEFNSETLKNGRVVPVRDPKDVVVNLPNGLLGNPQATSRCPAFDFLRGVPCAASTQVGTIRVAQKGGTTYTGGVYNLVPEKGQSAEFGLENPSGVNFILTAHVVRLAQGASGCALAGGCYGLAIVSSGIPMVELYSTEVTFWGVPADASHDVQRGRTCTDEEDLVHQVCSNPGGGVDTEEAHPFLTLPADCADGPVTGSVSADSWQAPGTFVAGPPASLAAPTGCASLGFNPEIELLPDTKVADSPVGLGVDVKVPQNEALASSASPQLRDAVVTLPAGMSINPSVVDGVQACEESGPEGINFAGPYSEEVGSSGESQLAPGRCPDASTVGTAEAITPLLGAPVKGHVYLARPGCGGAGQKPCTEQDAVDGNLYKLYLELGGTGALADAGVNIKVPGFVEANPTTGQLTTKFLDDPQLPFSELKVALNGGPRASIANPQVCGLARTIADFKPWSAPGTFEGVFERGTPDGLPFSEYKVEGCASPIGLSPGFSAGTVTPTAGAFSPFTLTFTRKGREQDLSGIQVHTPPGLLGMLSNVPLCGEPQAAQGTCAASSRIGSTTVATGAGSHPFEIGGTAYLTGPYDGAPFGLSVVTDAVAGPFDLGLIVVQAKINVDPSTSALTITSDPLPQIVFGVPLRLQRVTVDVDRPSFMFNPTNCGAQQITATISGEQGAAAQVHSPFAAGACKTLTFKPTFTVSTAGKTSRTRGASLDAKLSFPSLPPGSQANVAHVKVSLPRQLPSRLSTLQKACAAATFSANPAACPKASIVGIAKTSTPLLPVQLSGPVYFVSHGGEAFPNLIVVLQGDNVRVDLVGDTFISKAGITSSTFKTVPDVPVRSFELYLPEGRDSALAANGSLCRQAGKLVMPTEMDAQNGAVFKQSTKIKVTGCAKSKASKAGSARMSNDRRRGAGRGIR